MGLWILKFYKVRGDCELINKFPKLKVCKFFPMFSVGESDFMQELPQTQFPPIIGKYFLASVAFASIYSFYLFASLQIVKINK